MSVVKTCSKTHLCFLFCDIKYINNATLMIFRFLCVSDRVVANKGLNGAAEAVSENYTSVFLGSELYSFLRK